MTQPFNQITDHTLCQVNVPNLAKDFFKVEVHLFRIRFDLYGETSVISLCQIGAIHYVF